MYNSQIQASKLAFNIMKQQTNYNTILAAGRFTSLNQQEYDDFFLTAKNANPHVQGFALYSIEGQLLISYGIEAQEITPITKTIAQSQLFEQETYRATNSYYFINNGSGKELQSFIAGITFSKKILNLELQEHFVKWLSICFVTCLLATIVFIIKNMIIKKYRNQINAFFNQE